MFTADRQLGTNRWEVVRIVPGHRTEVVLHSAQFFELTTHWAGRSVLCPGEDCRLCETHSARGLFYTAVKWNSRVSILELGSVSAGHLEQTLKLFAGGMRAGLVVELSRRNPKHPVKSEYVREAETLGEVSLIDLARHVLALYKFPCPNVGENLEAYETRCRGIAKMRADRIATTLPNARK